MQKSLWEKTSYHRTWLYEQPKKESIILKNINPFIYTNKYRLIIHTKYFLHNILKKKSRKLTSSKIKIINLYIIETFLSFQLFFEEMVFKNWISYGSYTYMMLSLLIIFFLKIFFLIWYITYIIQIFRDIIFL